MKTVDALAERAMELRKKGLSENEIGDELHLSKNTITWLLTRDVATEKPPADVKVGWRSVGVLGRRVAQLASIFSDIILEESDNKGFEIDTVVGIAINGIPLATIIAEELDKELSIYRPPVHDESQGTFSSNYATLTGKNVAIIDDVISTGTVIQNAIADLRAQDAKPQVACIIVNKTATTEIDGVLVRSLIRARTIA